MGSSSSASNTTVSPPGATALPLDVTPESADAAADAAAAQAAPTLRVPEEVLTNLLTSFLFAAGPKVLETRDKTEAATGSSSAEAGGISGPGVEVGTPAKGSVVGAVVGVVVAAPEVGVGVAPELVVGVDADLATPTRDAREARLPNLEMRSVRADSTAAVAEEEEEESEGRGGSTEGVEGGGEGEVEVERPGIDVNIEDQEKLTAGVTCSESTGAQ